MSVGIGKLKPVKIGYTWEIENFCTTCKNVGDRLYSPTFSTVSPDGGSIRWYFALYPKGLKTNPNDIYLYLFKESNRGIALHFDFSILDSKNNVIIKRSLSERKFDVNGWGCSVKRELLTSQSENLLKNSVLKMFIEIFFEPTPEIQEQKKRKRVSDGEIHLEKKFSRTQEFDDFEKLLESQKNSDVTLIVEDTKFLVHKIILASRSPFFAAMLQRPTRGKKRNIIDIEDMTSTIMQEFLRFVYAGKVNKIDEIAKELLIAADKYSVNGLKAMCEESLYKNLNADNVIEYLKLAAVSNATGLKNHVIDFIVTRLENVAYNPEFTEFGNSHPQIVCEVVRAIADKKLK